VRLERHVLDHRGLEVVLEDVHGRVERRVHIALADLEVVADVVARAEVEHDVRERRPGALGGRVEEGSAVVDRPDAVNTPGSSS
jgi:hypothetical protein